MKNLHILTNDKFIVPYINLINENFEHKEHLFLILGEGIDGFKLTQENVKYVTKNYKSFKMLLKAMYKSKRIFIHGLFSPYLVLLLSIQIWLLKKSYWSTWGGDLYYHQHRNKNIKSNFFEIFRKIVIRNFAGIITPNKGDYKLAQKWYKAKGKRFHSIKYPSNLYKEFDITKINYDKNKIYIQVGNSADSTNNHLEVFNRLQQYKYDKYTVFVPLSYGGNSEYKNQIIHSGEEIFGEFFEPLENFISLDEYLKILAKVDVAIFNHERQQAMGNILTLLGLGKKVYIRDDISTWEYLKELGIKVYSINKDTININYPNEIKENNINLIKTHFSKETLILQWKKLFEI